MIGCVMAAAIAFALGMYAAWRPRFLERRSMRRIIAGAGIQARTRFAKDPECWFSLSCGPFEAQQLGLEDDLKRCGFIKLGGDYQGMVCVNFAGELEPVDPRPNQRAT